MMYRNHGPDIDTTTGRAGHRVDTRKCRMWSPLEII
jgi:hypothetical protein